jgi:hypothetical protein
VAAFGGDADLLAQATAAWIEVEALAKAGRDTSAAMERLVPLLRKLGDKWEAA